MLQPDLTAQLATEHLQRLRLDAARHRLARQRPDGPGTRARVLVGRRRPRPTP